MRIVAADFPPCTMVWTQVVIALSTGGTVGFVAELLDTGGGIIFTPALVSYLDGQVDQWIECPRRRAHAAIYDPAVPVMMFSSFRSPLPTGC
jgi:uncharacterized membrane protein YfcA